MGCGKSKLTEAELSDAYNRIQELKAEKEALEKAAQSAVTASEVVLTQAPAPEGWVPCEDGGYVRAPEGAAAPKEPEQKEPPAHGSKRGAGGDAPREDGARRKKEKRNKKGR